MKVAILGFSREGASTLRFLKKQKLVFGDPQKKTEYWILDQKKNTKIPQKVSSRVGKDYLKDIRSFDYVLRSPGIPYSKKELIDARRSGVQFSSLTKLFFDACPCPVIGITGTRGKGTVATMLYKILKTAGKDVYLLGNIGIPALDLLPRLRKTSLVIYELSSFQLQDLTTSPHIAIVLHITPDHLDSHKDFKEYVESKTQITKHQKKSDFVYYVANDRLASSIARKSNGKKIKVSPKDFSLFPPSLLYLPAPHLFENAVLAATVALQLKVKPEIIKKALTAFRANKFRLEPLGKKKGITYINDSGAANPLGTIAALKSFSQPIILIAGGKNKGIDYRPLAEAINKTNIRAVILIGEISRKLKVFIKNPDTTLASSLEEAVRLAKSKAQKGDVILFSPGTSSYDMFKDFEDRGRQFTNIFKSLPS